MIGALPTFADESKDVSEKEVIDMYEIAKKQYDEGLTANSLQFGTIKNSNGAEYKVKAFKLYESAKTVNSNEYTQTYLISTDKENIVPMGTVNDPVDTWDDSLSVHGYLTIVYTVEDTDEELYGDEYLLKSVNGKWIIDDTSVSILDRNVVMVCRDFTDYSQRIEKYPSSNQFSYNTGFTYAVNEYMTYGMVGAVSTATLEHGTSTWEFELQNYIINNN